MQSGAEFDAFLRKFEVVPVVKNDSLCKKNTIRFSQFVFSEDRTSTMISLLLRSMDAC